VLVRDPMNTPKVLKTTLVLNTFVASLLLAFGTPILAAQRIERDLERASKIKAQVLPSDLCVSARQIHLVAQITVSHLLRRTFSAE